ncbi:MAG: T9SS type A sorting domain-containing protein [Bacteroidales bacterium]|nr:T9SS type A sorting domain-containing protein [Bacteroidales bacterium]
MVIYPAPSNNRINSLFGNEVKVSILLNINDVTSRMIYSTEYNDIRQGQVYSVKTSEFNEGIYLLNVISADSRNTRKIVVRH